MGELEDIKDDGNVSLHEHIDNFTGKNEVTIEVMDDFVHVKIYYLNIIQLC